MFGIKVVTIFLASYWYASPESLYLTMVPTVAIGQ